MGTQQAGPEGVLALHRRMQGIAHDDLVSYDEQEHRRLQAHVCGAIGLFGTLLGWNANATLVSSDDESLAPGPAT